MAIRTIGNVRMTPTRARPTQVAVLSGRARPAAVATAPRRSVRPSSRHITAAGIRIRRANPARAAEKMHGELASDSAQTRTERPPGAARTTPFRVLRHRLSTFILRRRLPGSVAMAVIRPFGSCQGTGGVHEPKIGELDALATSQGSGEVDTLPATASA
jgi:hypothetical protein